MSKVKKQIKTMIFKFDSDWRIAIHIPYGYKVQQYYPNSGQWKNSTFHVTLEQAAKHLFEEQLRTPRYENTNIDLSSSGAAQLLDSLVWELKEIAKTISEACNGKDI